ncbi:DUF389 domain-containing protein [Sinimarinibacterium sp. CAU 1509]|uniref:DUF389 domain-containing protein n=1 Tax=Sinimarinibacterium sp. CAU 1509 TaxID=2562283 RepID=UPI0010ABF10F|nr:DUF389 domain-containing protein [Sinimarinibacterium sp. CAU 1509]TJY61982.1 DUF389 domain-containing protein [Sinimarinibacterium sp. CAU 1509]
MSEANPDTEPAATAGVPSRVVLICDDPDEPLLEQVRSAAVERGIDLLEVDAAALIDAPQRASDVSDWIVVASEGKLPQLADAAVRQRARVAVIPQKGSAIPRLLDLPKGLDERLELAFSSDVIEIDATYCNDELVLGVAAIGDVPFLDTRGRAFVRAQSSLRGRWAAAVGVFIGTVRRLFSIRPTRIGLQIGDEEKPRRTAVTGIVVLENDADHLSAQLLGEASSARNGRLSAMLFAPASVAAYIAALIRATIGVGSLPSALSMVQTRSLQIECDQPLHYRIDGRPRSAKQIFFEVRPRALSVKAGARFGDDNPEGQKDRDTLRLKTLPENEARLASISSRLPLFTHALEDDFKELFQLLRENARVSPDFVILMLASSLLAGFGLVMNSAAVIIGAMVLAPLMAPIVSLSMGILRRDTRLLQQAGRTIAIGVALALSAAALLALITPLQRVTAEIDARLHPSLLDLAVAVISGIAAAYAYARESVIKSLPGVAIAVALVPPLAVAGIGLGWGDLRIFGGAALLFLTNLVGIAATAALTFLVLGYAPIHTAVRGLRVLAVATLLMALPLTVSFAHIVQVWRYENAVVSDPVAIGARDLELTETSVRVDGDTVVVRATVVSAQPLTAQQADHIKLQLQQRLDAKVRVELQQRLVR